MDFPQLPWQYRNFKNSLDISGNPLHLIRHMSREIFISGQSYIFKSPDVAWSKFPLLHSAEGIGVDTLRNINAVGHLVDVFERTLDTVKNCTHNARAKLHGQGLAGTQDGVADCDA